MRYIKALFQYIYIYMNIINKYKQKQLNVVYMRGVPEKKNN